MKISFRKGSQIYAAHIEETVKDKEPCLEYYPILKDYEYVFWELSGSPPKRDIDFSIELIHGGVSISKTPYRMSTP
jgi:hypothetical protein